jgi:hypothetical protein
LQKQQSKAIMSLDYTARLIAVQHAGYGGTISDAKGLLKNIWLEESQ